MITEPYKVLKSQNKKSLNLKQIKRNGAKQAELLELKEPKELYTDIQKFRESDFGFIFSDNKGYQSPKFPVSNQSVSV